MEIRNQTLTIGYICSPLIQNSTAHGAVHTEYCTDST